MITTNTQPLVSVCMITYNQASYLKQAIDGVLIQRTSFPIELIIADDCATDETELLVKEIQQNTRNTLNIKYFRHEKNIGMQSNFAFALSKCTGKYIALCEGDDYWVDASKLQKQVDFLESDEKFVLIFHPVDILMPNGEIIDDFITSIPNTHEDLIDLVQYENYIHTPSVVFKNVLSNYPTAFFKIPTSDYFLYLLLAEKGKIKFFNEKMAVYRYGVGIWSSQSVDYQYVKKAKVNALLASHFKDSPIIADIYTARVVNFLLYNRDKVDQKNLEDICADHLFCVSLIDFIFTKQDVMNYFISSLPNLGHRVIDIKFTKQDAIKYFGAKIKLKDLLSIIFKRVYSRISFKRYKFGGQ